MHLKRLHYSGSISLGNSWIDSRTLDPKHVYYIASLPLNAAPWQRSKYKTMYQSRKIHEITPCKLKYKCQNKAKYDLLTAFMETSFPTFITKNQYHLNHQKYQTCLKNLTPLNPPYSCVHSLAGVQHVNCNFHTSSYYMQRFYSSQAVSHLPPNLQFQRIKFLSLLEQGKLKQAHLLLNEIGTDSSIYPNLMLRLLMIEKKLGEFERFRNQIFEAGQENNETFEIWMEYSLQFNPEQLHDVYGIIMRREDIVPTIRTLQIILHATDSEQFLLHCVGKILETLTYEAQSNLNALHRKKSEVAMLLSEALDKCMQYKQIDLSKNIILRHRSFNISFNFEMSQRIISFFCVVQDFDFALRFISTMMPKLDTDLRFKDSSSNVPIHALLLVLHSAAEFGYSDVVEGVVHEILNISQCDITTLEAPLNSIILHAVFKAYLFNEAFEQAFETVSRMKECNVHPNHNYIVSLIRLYLNAHDDADVALRNIITTLKNNRDLINAEIVIILMKAVNSDLKRSEFIFREFSFVEPQAPKELALAQVYALHRKTEESYSYFTKAITRNTPLEQEELSEYCKLFFYYSIESSLEVFICIYQLFKENTSQKLLVHLLRRASRIGNHTFQDLLDKLQEAIAEEHWPYFEEVISRTRRNLEVGRSQKERFIVHKNELLYLVPDEL